MRFKLLSGTHRTGSCRLWDRNTGLESRPNTVHRFVANDPKNNVIETDTDLIAKFRDGRSRFERLPDEPDTNGKAKAK